MKNNQQTKISDLEPEKGNEAKEQALNKPTQQKPNSKARWLVSYKTVLQNRRTVTNSNCHTSPREELTKQLPLKDQKKKKNGETPQPPDKTKTEPLLKYQHQDWMLKE
jgi:hypothetical protein